MLRRRKRGCPSGLRHVQHFLFHHPVASDTRSVLDIKEVTSKATHDVVKMLLRVDPNDFHKEWNCREILLIGSSFADISKRSY
jgi:hypothetical protein